MWGWYACILRFLHARWVWLQSLSLYPTDCVSPTLWQHPLTLHPFFLAFLSNLFFSDFFSKDPVWRVPQREKPSFLAFSVFTLLLSEKQGSEGQGRSAPKSRSSRLRIPGTAGQKSRRFLAHFWTTKKHFTLPQKESGKRSLAKKWRKKWQILKHQKKWPKSDRKRPENEKVIELLLLHSFCSTLSIAI